MGREVWRPRNPSLSVLLLSLQILQDKQNNLASMARNSHLILLSLLPAALFCWAFYSVKRQEVHVGEATLWSTTAQWLREMKCFPDTCWFIMLSKLCCSLPPLSSLRPCGGRTKKNHSRRSFYCCCYFCTRKIRKTVGIKTVL